MANIFGFLCCRLHKQHNTRCVLWWLWYWCDECYHQMLEKQPDRSWVVPL